MSLTRERCTVCGTGHLNGRPGFIGIPRFVTDDANEFIGPLFLIQRGKPGGVILAGDQCSCQQTGSEQQGECFPKSLFRGGSFLPSGPVSLYIRLQYTIIYLICRYSGAGFVWRNREADVVVSHRVLFFPV